MGVVGAIFIIPLGGRLLDMTITPSSSLLMGVMTDGIATMLPEGLISFNNKHTICNKVHYTQEKELSGVVMWELSGNVLANLSTPLIDMANMKLAQSLFKCCTLHSEDKCKRELLEVEQQAANSQLSGFVYYREWNPSSAGSDESGQSGGRGQVALIL
jgi:hypothetical protein